MLVLVCVVLGLTVGSFLNVVVWRVPRGESVVSPPSHCPGCGRPVRPRDNIPVVSWLLLRGRCRDCGTTISRRYPLVEAGTGALFGLAAWWLGPVWVLPAVLYLAAISVALALIDIDHRRLPDAIVLPSYLVVLVLLVLASWNPGGAPDWSALLRAVVGGAAMYVIYFVLCVVHPRGMGFGDVKLAGVLGMVLGWFGVAELVVGWFGGFLLGGLWGLGLMAARRAGRKTQVPFGPWMLLGALLALPLGEPLARAYLAAAGL